MRNDQFRYKWWALLGVCLLAFTAFLDATIVNTALPFIQTALGADILQLQWVANIFTIVLSMSLIALGKFSDLWGRKKVFYIGVCLFAIAAFGAGFSPNIQLLVLFRGMQSLGASAILVASAALLSTVFPEKQRVRAISIYAGVTGFGLMLGPFLGGILIALLDWRWVFWINLPLIAIGLAACSFSLRGHSHPKPSTRIDWMGLFLLIFGLGSLLYGIIAGAQSHWMLEAWIWLGLGVVALTCLLILDARAKNSLLDLHIFKKKLMILAALSCAFGGVVSTVFMFFDPLYLRILRQLSPFLIGLLVAMIPAAQVIISFAFHRLEKWFGVANLLFVSNLIAFLAVILHRFLQLETPLVFLTVPFFLLGINWGLSNAATLTAANQVISSHQIGAAMGMIFTVWNLVGSILLAASTAVFHATEVHASFLPAFHHAIDFNIAFAAVVFLGALWVRIRLSSPKSPDK
jgi:EmrB/QacA subfamily drug resistance transporter